MQTRLPLFHTRATLGCPAPMLHPQRTLQAPAGRGEEPPSGAPPATSATDGGAWCHWSLGSSANFWSLAMVLSLSQHWTLQTFLSQHKKTFHCLWLAVLQSLQELFNWWRANTFATKIIQCQEAATGESFFTGGFPGGAVVKNSPANAGDMGSIPGLKRSPGVGNGNLLQYSCLENPMDRGE